MPEIRRISRHRHLPKVVVKATKIEREMIGSRKQKTENERRHSRLRMAKRVPEREKVVLANVE